MDFAEIRENFLTIGYRTPLTETPDELGRRRIGTFGIGCLSVFPYCDRLRVITKKRNGDSIIELDIDTKLFFTEEQAFRFIEQAQVPYQVYPCDLPKEKGETIIVLEGIKPHIAQELQQEESKGKSSIDKLGGFQKFKWTLSQYAPIQFPPSRKDLRDFFGTSGTVPMRLWLDVVSFNIEILCQRYSGHTLAKKGLWHTTLYFRLAYANAHSIFFIGETSISESVTLDAASETRQRGILTSLAYSLGSPVRYPGKSSLMEGIIGQYAKM